MDRPCRQCGLNEQEDEGLCMSCLESSYDSGGGGNGAGDGGVGGGGGGGGSTTAAAGDATDAGEDLSTLTGE
jgi:hypothetical protein